ncbi:hypothetical protein CCR75_006319 [Bremia lactucae]|uniref:Homeobox domain-containing protein n=1 Tax=Bremia lactucae TaxID=4779 RepID=A0A976ICM5_BRELC|nr:hypothetical protein CCR75_006319 [Bremia lactucae]
MLAAVYAEHGIDELGHLDQVSMQNALVAALKSISAMNVTDAISPSMFPSAWLSATATIKSSLTTNSDLAVVTHNGNEAKQERLMKDVEKESKTELDDATERKKSLLVYKANHQSLSDDDDDDDASQAVESVESVEGVSSPFGIIEDHNSAEIRRLVLGGVDDEVDEDDNEQGAEIERGDDEFLNLPSDDDMDSTATPRRSETDDDGENRLNGRSTFEPVFSDLAEINKKKIHSETKLASEAAVNNAPSPTRSGVIIQHVEEPTVLSLKSGASNVNAIISARRRTITRKECEACHEPRNGRRALVCLQCKCMYHSSCFRRQFPKLAMGINNRQWYCLDCEPAVNAAAIDSNQTDSSCLQQSNDSSGRSRNISSSKSNSTSRSKSEVDHRSAQLGIGISAALESEVQRLTDLVYRGGKSINALILEQTGEMLRITQALRIEINSVMGSSWHGKDTQHGNTHVSHVISSDLAREEQQQHVDYSLMPPVVLAHDTSSQIVTPFASSASVKIDDTPASNDNGVFRSDGAWSEDSEKYMLLRRVHNGLDSLKQLLEQLQVAGIQFEVDRIKEVRATLSQDRKPAFSSSTRKQGSGAAGRSASGSKGKSGASRLYSSKQIQKLEEWYQRSSRPESSEIHSMYRIINCPDYADPELQPEGISVKRIRIWFDNRRAKERLEYMRLKMKDISTTDMDADSVKKMKAAYIDEAKEVLEARVSRMRENGQGSCHVVDEADMALIANIIEPSMLDIGPKSSSHGAGKAISSLLSTSKDGSDRIPTSSGPSTQKKRIRIGYVASVRKAMKEARDAGKNEEETKVLRTAAMDRARERLHVPYKNARTGPSKPLGKDEISHIKMKMLKLLEEDAPAEELTDIIELLLTLIIPRAVLIDSGMQRQLELVLIAHKDNKELVRQTKKLQEEFQSIVENGDSPSVMAAMSGEATSSKNRKEQSRSLLLSVDTEHLPGTPGSSPNSGPTPSPESRRPRVKFSLAQLVKLEKYFHKEDTPSKKKLDKIAARLNGIACMDPSSDAAQRSIDYKQIRCWFYKRRSANQPPQALSGTDLHIDKAASSSSSSSDTESDNDSKSDRIFMTSTSSKAKGLAFVPSGTTAKRKAPFADDDRHMSKRPKKEIFFGQPASTKFPITETTAFLANKNDENSDSSMQKGRIFNVKQLATIIEEYEKNPRPTDARLEDLQKLLNKDDHMNEQAGDGVCVTKQQIKMWFSSRRAKERLDLINMKYNETQAGLQGSRKLDFKGNEDEGIVSMRPSTHASLTQAGQTSNLIRNIAFDDSRESDNAEDMKVDA